MHPCPNSANLYDSLAEVYEFQWDKVSVLKHYRLSLGLEVQNTHTAERIAVLGGRLVRLLSRILLLGPGLVKFAGWTAVY